MLIHFRLQPIALMADVEKAFLQLGLDQSDRDVTRFLWLKDVNLPVDADNLVGYRFCRVPFGVISSPFLLSATIQHHLSKEQYKVTEEIQNNMYVDNMLAGASSPNEALSFYEEAKTTFDGASMNLRSWASNCKEFVELLPEEDRSDAQIQKCLGLQWDTVAETFNINPISLAEDIVHTKRSILKTLASFYDPLGFHIPVIVRAKCLLQDIWKEGYDWDDPLPNSYVQLWSEIATDLTHASTIKLPRYTDITNSSGSTELHIFCDASQKAYGACAYLRQTNGDEQSSHLIMCKTRVAPVKEHTIPRLELMATLLGIRLVHFIRTQLPLQFNRVCVWTDSICVLGWINAPQKKQPVFIENRLTEIRAESGVQFHHVISEENPADFPSRGSSVSTSLENTMWWHGPAWLVVPQLESGPSVSVLLQPEGPTEQTQPFSTPAGINPSDFTSFGKMLRVTAYVCRFIQCTRGKPVPHLALSGEEIHSAEIKWLQFAQHSQHQEVFDALQNQGSNDLVNKHGLLLDDGIIKCEGRMGNAPMPDETKYPIFLSGKSDVSKLIISDVHRKLLHGGTNATLTAVRRRFWVTRGRETVKRVLGQCKVCKRFDGGPFSMPTMPQYPKDKVTAGSAPFTTTGIDYFGPVMVKVNSNPVKAWVVLFTCLTTRAVHLEVATDMTIRTFLMMHRRFTARSGTPRKVISDNAKQFKLASTTIDAVWQSIEECSDVLNYISTRGTKWAFITELAPWMGGFYERMVQTVKRSLRKSIGRSLLTLSEFETLLVECEAAVNTRPLTYVSNDPDQLVITPAHFLCMNPNLGFPGVNADINDPEFNPDSNATDMLLEQLKQGQVRVDRFWEIWSEEYLAALRERGGNQLRQRRVRDHSLPAVGDIIIAKDDHLPRAAWSLGRITQLYLSADNEIRSASIRVPSGRTNKHPLCLIYPMECSRVEVATDAVPCC